MDVNICLIYALAIANTLIFATRLTVIGTLYRRMNEKIDEKLKQPIKDMLLGVIISLIMTGCVVITVGLTLTFGWGVNVGVVGFLCIPSAFNWSAANWMSKIDEIFWDSIKEKSRVV